MRDHMLHNVRQRHILPVERGQRFFFYPAQKTAERQSAVNLHADRQGIDKHSHHRLQVRVPPTSHRSPHDDVILPAQAEEQDVKTGE